MGQAAHRLACSSRRTGRSRAGSHPAPTGSSASWSRQSPAKEDGLPLGSPAPDLALVGLDGEPVALVDPDRETLLVFWNPACGFCRSMHKRCSLRSGWQTTAHPVS